MEARLLAALPLLAPGGFIAISIDDEVRRLRVLLDEIFGNGRTKTIVVKTAKTHGLKMASVRRHGTVSKTKESSYWSPPASGGADNLIGSRNQPLYRPGTSNGPTEAAWRPCP